MDTVKTTGSACPLPRSDRGHPENALLSPPWL